MPKGAVISPPDSASSGSDDESTPEIRGRNLDRLKDLRNAVGQIQQARAQSPSGFEEQPQVTLSPEIDVIPTSRGIHLSFSTSVLGDLQHHARKVSHVRSATEPNAPMLDTADNSITASEEDTDEDLKKKPQMVRKKSGELVRPALRPSSRRRPSSMPGTPVFSKAVHFDSHLEHVRHFLQVDRPLAVSAGSSPADNYESDNEYPFPNEKRPGSKGPPFEWEIVTPNFPHDTHDRQALPVKLEKVWLSADQKSMLGSVAVANLAYQKQIVCRFTLDYWKTTSEVSAQYSHEIRPSQTPTPYDRFTFSIKLADTANLESKTLFFCVRYSVNGDEFWDNNSNANFQVDFKKKHLPQNGKNNFQGAGSKLRNGLPRSNRQTAPRPKSMPTSLDEFGNDPSFNYDQPIHEYLGESAPGLRLKSKSSSNIASDNIAKGLNSPSGAAFANRYDFGASLSAAVQAAKDSAGKDKDALYMKDNQRPPRTTAAHHSVPPTAPARPMPVVDVSQSTSGTSSPVPSLPSASYEELVNKYCFFGSKQSSPTIKDGTLRSGQFDGSAAVSTSNAAVNASDLPRQLLHTDTTNPYFIASTPDASPVGGYVSDYLAAGNKASAAMNLSSTPMLPPMAGPPPSQQQRQGLAERFLWRADSQTPTVIRG